MKNNRGEFIGCLIYCIFVIGFLALGIFIAYKISTSDLPWWFKLWQLRR